MARILITGGNGFIATHLIASCLGRGDAVHVTLRPGSRPVAPEHRSRVVEHRLELADRAALDRCIEASQPDQVYHLAVRTRRQPEPSFGDALASINEDLVQLVTLVAACAEARTPPRAFVRAGSLAEYGPGPAPYQEGQREQPLNAYCAALVAGTHYLQMLRPRLPFAAVTARLALVYGEGQRRDFLIPALIDACLRNRPFVLRRPGDRRDLLHVADAVDALCLIGERAEATDLVNVATGEAPCMAEVAGMIIEAAGARPDLVRIEPAADGPDTVRDLVASTGRARELLGWHARRGLRDGLAGLVRAEARQRTGTSP